MAKKPAGPTKSEPVEHLDELIYTIAPEINSIYAGTSNGLLRGDAFGNGWTRVSSLKLDEVRFVALNGHTLLAASLKEMQVSANGGQTWKPVALPQPFTQISTLAVDNEKTIWVGGREGLFRSSDLGESWQPTTGLLLNDVDSIYFDAAANRLLVTTAQSNFVFAVHLPDYKVNYWNSGWKLRFARPVGDHLIAATLFDGIVVQPLMVDSAVAPTKLSGPNPAPSVATATSPTAAAETTTKQ